MRPNEKKVINHEFRILKRLHNGVNNLVGFPKIFDRYMINKTENKKGK